MGSNSVASGVVSSAKRESGDVGFDPLGISYIDNDFSEAIVPGAAVMREGGFTDTSPVDTLYWMRESELKHGRIAQLDVVGWILVDRGLRFPGDKYAAISLSVNAHDPMVASGNMTIMLLGVFILELVGGAAIFGAATGPVRRIRTFSSRGALGRSYSSRVYFRKLHQALRMRRSTSMDRSASLSQGEITVEGDLEQLDGNSIRSNSLSVS